MHKDDEWTEVMVVDRILKGETALYEWIVRRFNPYLYKVGRSYQYNHEDTEDLMQDTYVDAFRALAQFERRSNFKTWLIRIMLNNCYQKKQKSSYKNEIVEENMHENLHPMFTHSDNDANREIMNKELGHIIEQSLERLPNDYRVIFALREMNGLNVAETADMLHISENNVKVRLNRAKVLLRSELERVYSMPELYEFNLIYCDAMVERVMRKIME